MRSSVELDISPPLELERMAGGELVAIRTARGGDETLLRELALDLAQTRRRARHLGWMGVANRIPRPLQPLTRLESLEECLVAIDARDGRAIGMASIAPTPGEPAVAAPWVTVRESLRRRGVGTALLERLAVHARQHGHDRFRLQMVVSEQRMLELLRRVGIQCRPVRSLREVEAEVPLPGGDGLGVALGAALWAVARGGLSPTVPRA